MALLSTSGSVPPRTAARRGGTGQRTVALVAAVVAASVVMGLIAAVDPRIALGLIVAASGGILVVQRPAIGALLLVALVPVTSGLRPGLPVPGARLSEALIGGIAAVMILSRHRDDTVPWRSLDWLALAYAFGALVLGSLNTVLRGEAITGAGLSVMVGPVQFFLLYRAIAVGLRDARQRRLAIQLILFVSIPVSILAVLQQERLFGVQPFIESITGGGVFQTWSFRNFPRATSVFPSWHPLAGYLSIVLLLAVSVLVQPPRERAVGTRWLAVVGVLGLGALVYSETFTSMLAVIGGAFVILWFARSTKLLGWMLAGAAVFVLLATMFLGHRLERQFEADPDSVVPQTITYRWDVWTDQYVPVVSTYWSTGYGPELPEGIEWRHTESLYLTLLLRGGLPLLGTYIALMVSVGRHADRLRRHADPAIRASAQVVLAAVIVMVPMNSLFPYFTASGLAQVFWVALGLMMSAHACAGTTAGPAVGARHDDRELQLR